MEQNILNLYIYIMARGTKKRYFKKNKTRNNKKIRKQRRMKHSNKSRKRKQNKKSRKRKAGMLGLSIKYSELTRPQKEYLKEENIYTNEEIQSNPEVEDFVKHHLAHLDPKEYPNIYRPRGFITKRKQKEWDSETIKKYNVDMKTLYEDKKRINTEKKAIQELKKTVANAVDRLKKNELNELETITAIQNAIQEAEEAGIYPGDARNIAKPYISFLSQNAIQIAEDKRIYRPTSTTKLGAIQTLINEVKFALLILKQYSWVTEGATIITIQDAIDKAKKNGVEEKDVAMKDAKQHIIVLQETVKAKEAAAGAGAEP